MSNQDWAVIFGLAIVLLVVGLAIWGLLGLLRWIRKFKPVPEPKKSTPPWIWVFLIAVVALFTYVLSPRRPGGAPDPGPYPAWMVPVIIVGLPVVTFVVLIGYQLYRNYDRAATRALKRGQAGDTAGAIAELRAAIEKSMSPEDRSDETASTNPYAAPAPRRKGSAVRANALGALLSIREEWAEAYEWFVRAEEFGGRQAIYLGNQGLMLWKMGRAEEAAVLLEEACSLAPLDALQPCNLGQIFFDLGRIEEARQQLATAEANYKKLVMFPASAKKPIGVQIDALREKLAGVL
jgi:Tetratricopeptide repeat